MRAISGTINPPAKADPASEPRLLRYRPKISLLLASLLLGGFGGYYMSLVARKNAQGLSIQGLIELGPWGATRFYWLLTALLYAFPILTLAVAAPLLFVRRYIALHERSITIPSKWWWRNEPRRIYGDQISNVRVTSVNKHLFIEIIDRHGKSTINGTILARKRDLQEVLDWLRAQGWECSVKPPVAPQPYHLGR